MKIFKHRGQPVVLHPDAAQNDQTRAVVRPLIFPPDRDSGRPTVGPPQLVWRHELEETTGQVEL